MSQNMMRAVQFKEKGGKLELVQVPIPKPAPGQVRIKVQYCGLCHGDFVAKFGGMGNTWPRIPGHEVSGVLDEITEGVPQKYKVGDTVGVGWFGGTCGKCDQCLDGDVGNCQKNAHYATGIHFDGGMAEYLVVPWNALARIPSGMKMDEVAPLMCAGLTTFGALRKCGALGGDVVVVHGLGGLGHLGVQFARKLGYHTVAVSRGRSKEELAKELGAHVFLDSETQDIVKEIKALGGAKIILGTVPDAKAIEQLLPSLGPDGKLLLVAAVQDPIKINSMQLLMNKQQVVGWVSSGPKDIELTEKFSQLMGVKSMIEVFPLEKAQEAFDHMASSKVKFRSVIQIAK